MNRVLFVSFPRSGSNWYIQMIADSLDKPHYYVHGTLMRKSHRRTYGIGMSKMFFMYRHPKDAILSYAKFMVRDKEVVLSTELLKKILFTTNNFKGRCLIDWWRVLMDFFMKPEHQKTLCALKYEDILRNPEQTVANGLKHLGFTCEPKVERQLLHKTTKERFAFFTRRWERESVWTKKIDDMVDEQLRDYYRKYDYAE